MSDIGRFRAAKDAAFIDPARSPLTPAQREAFRGLAYYPEEDWLVFDVVPEPFPDQEAVTLQTSTGEEATYVRWARVRFTVLGHEATLTVFAEPGGGGFFLPFQDAGRGTETYGAGRYLEVEQLPDGRLRLDFNYAYNPYCAYNDGWSCPIPPAENRLDIHIRAGERDYLPAGSSGG